MVLATVVGMLLTGFFLFLLILAVAGIAISGMNKSPEVPDVAVLEFKTPVSFPERSPYNPLDALDEESGTNMQLGLLDIFHCFDRAAADKRIKGVVIRPELLSSGMASTAEVRNKILSFRKSGKFVYCYADFLSETAYYLASACDRIVMNPAGEMMFDGFSGSVVMYKGLLDKAGISFQVFRAGKYKSAVEPFIQKEISGENREQMQHLVNSMYSVFIRDISNARKLDSAMLVSYANNLMVKSPAEAVKLKLIDAVMPYDEFVDMVNKKAGLSAPKSEKNWLAAGDYFKTKDESEKYSRDKIAVIYGVGEIDYGSKNEAGTVYSKTMADAIRKAREDKQVKALVLRINSPGGSALASDIIAREVALTRKVKPVIASFGNVAASGGYYIACLADTIVCLPQSITGSIGVFGLIPNTQKLFEEHLGLNYETMPTAANSDFMRPDAPLNAAQSAFVQHSVNRIYADFLNVVARGRRTDTGYVHGIAQGRVWPGTDAVSIKLADLHGGFETALKLAAAKSGTKDYRIVEYPENRFSLSALFGNLGAMDAQLKETLGQYYEVFKQAVRAEKLRGVQMRMPFEVSVQ